jgi:hypothetical protein
MAAGRQGADLRVAGTRPRRGRVAARRLPQPVVATHLPPPAGGVDPLVRLPHRPGTDQPRPSRQRLRHRLRGAPSPPPRPQRPGDRNQRPQPPRGRHPTHPRPDQLPRTVHRSGTYRVTALGCHHRDPDASTPARTPHRRSRRRYCNRCSPRRSTSATRSDRTWPNSTASTAPPSPHAPRCRRCACRPPHNWPLPAPTTSTPARRWSNWPTPTNSNASPTGGRPTTHYWRSASTPWPNKPAPGCSAPVGYRRCGTWSSTPWPGSATPPPGPGTRPRSTGPTPATRHHGRRRCTPPN